LWLFLLSGSWLCLRAQEVSLSVDRVAIDGPPPQKQINAVLLSSSGFLWIGSQGGLARYDGYRVIPFTIDGGGEEDLPVRSLGEGSDGRLWLATPRGLVRFDPDQGTTVRFRHKAGSADTIGSDDLTCLHVAAALPGRLWLASAAGTLDELDMTSGRIRRCFPGPGPAAAPRPGRIHALGSDPAGVLWIGAENGLFRYLPLDGRLLPCPLPPSEPASAKPADIRALTGAIGADGAMWLGSANSGLLRYLPVAGAWQHCQEAGVFASPDDANVAINAIAPYPGDEANLLLGTEAGLYRFEPASGRCRRVSQLIDGKFIQGGRVIQAIHRDRQGIYWIGSRDDGLFKWSLLRKKFSHYLPFAAAKPSPLANWVTFVLELANGDILVTTYGGGAFFFDRASGAFRPWVFDPGRPGRRLNSFVMDARLLRDGSLWLASGEGLVRCSAAARFQELFALTSDPSEDLLPFTFIQDRRGLIWIASDRGLVQLDPKSGALRRFRHDRLDPRSLSHDWVNAVLEEPDGAIWVATNDGLNLYLLGEDRFTVFKNDSADPAGLAGSQVNFLLRDGRDRLWAGTSAGLERIERKGERVVFHHYRAPGSDPNQNQFRSLVEDGNGRFWTGTSAGLASFDSERGTFVFYDRRDGVDAEGLNEAFVTVRSRDGEIFLGGRNGLTRFRPSEIAINLQPPPLVATGYRIYDSPADAATAGLLPTTPQPRSVASQKVVHLEFAALDFTRSDKNQYAYRLDGRDRDWTYQGNQRVVVLEKLLPGSYTLRVKAANNEGVWNDNGIAWAIVVRRPFWVRWRFPILAAALLLLATAILLWRRWRLRRLRRAAVPDNLDRVLEKFAISKREAEIVRLLLAGKSNKEIEAELFIAMATVKIHVHNIFRKVRVGNRLQLVLRLQQEAKKLG
jgi:ligand-binding sensor domain-containing protein/DNA-binding CsgD family transcriptional regulator